MAEVFGGKPVAPLSLIPLIVLIAIAVASTRSNTWRLPRLAGPLFLFAAVAVASTLLSPWLGLGPFQGQDVVARGIRGIATLGIGLGFFLAAALVPSDDRRLRVSLIALNLGAVLMLLWSTVQLAVVLDAETLVPQWVDDVHEWISLRAPFPTRVTGFAYEPSWLADQLVILYLPLWTACIGHRVSLSRRRLWGLSVEHGLLLWGGIMLVGSLSRIGLLAWALVVAVLALVAGWRFGRRRTALNARSAREQAGQDPRLSRFKALVSVSVVAMVLLAAGVVALLFLSRVDPRVARILTLPTAELSESRHPPWYSLANRLKYAERVIYWTAAARTFGQYPVLGVGLGNSGFLFRETVPAFGYLLPEILESLDPASGLFPNPKSLWFRLLAETGLVGTAAFLTWLVIVAAAGNWLMRRRRGFDGALGLAAQLSLLALVLEGLSLDTFALPYLWILPGMAAAAWVRAGRDRPGAVEITRARIRSPEGGRFRLTNRDGSRLMRTTSGSHPPLGQMDGSPSGSAGDGPWPIPIVYNPGRIRTIPSPL